MKNINELRVKFPNLINKEEALKRKIKIKKDWRNAEKGDFICTKDNIVLEVLKTSKKEHYNGQKPTKHVHTEIGRFPVTIRCVYAKRIPLNDDGNLLGSCHLKSIFAQDMIEHGKIGKNGRFTPQSIIENYMPIYADNNEVNALIRGRKILKNKNVRKYMSKNMKEAFEKEKWDLNKVAKKYTEFIDDEKIPANVRKQCLDIVRESFDIKEEGEQGFQYMLKGADQKQLKGISQFFALINSYKAQNKIIDGEFIDINEFAKEAVKLLKE